MKTIRVGSRDSVLALAQANLLKDCITKHHPELAVEIVPMKTKGDRILNQSLDKVGGKGLFVQELEGALRSKKLDLAIHSYKDVPYKGEADLPIVALSQRNAPLDALVLPPGQNDLDLSQPIGTSSLRRTFQIKALYPAAQVHWIRGNVLTRLAKLDRGEYGALVLAQAGLERLNLGHRISRLLSPEEFVPSASQGILAVQGRATDCHSYLAEFHSQESELVSLAERSFLEAMDGGCTAPVAAYCRLIEDHFVFDCLMVNGEGQILRQREELPLDRLDVLSRAGGEKMKAWGKENAEILKNRGGSIWSR